MLINCAAKEEIWRILLFLNLLRGMVITTLALGMYHVFQLTCKRLEEITSFSPVLNVFLCRVRTKMIDEMGKRMRIESRLLRARTHLPPLGFMKTVSIILRQITHILL